MEKPRPFLSTAVLCESVIEEKNGTISLVRIAEKITIQSVVIGPEGSANDFPPGFKPYTKLSGLVGVKAGAVRGSHQLKIVGEKPDGTRQELFSYPVTFTGAPEQGQNIILNLTFGIDLYGLYWFDVVFDDDVLTRIPLTVESAPALAASQIQEPKRD